MFKFKINDLVKITSGKDKGQTGKILKVFPGLNKVLVEGKNTYRRHVKKQLNQPGQILTLERPLPVANIALICPSCQKMTRIAFDVTQKPKVRVCRKCGQIINTTVNAKS